ncbi:hypothetical protein Ga0061068_10815 [Tepidiphilus thermophilus]|uniref:Uncharacterized protein n=1 Tax=Tepidiphilus thermophilus TaxID=876478 RepID=A0A0K6IWQ8_9PROT|nr:hypothetical protein Ga0061068_10815 [Tepidiphilus thermophilus]
MNPLAVEKRTKRRRCHVAWAVFSLWFAYSAALLGWHAWTIPAPDVCFARR